MANDAFKTGLVPIARGETVSEYNERWSDWREDEGLPVAGESRRGIRYHFCGGYKHGHLPIQVVEKLVLERFVRYLDDLVGDDEISWKTAANNWSHVSALFRDATHAKNPALRILSVNPAQGVAPPDKGIAIQKQFLYPNEFLQLVSCPDVPLERAELYSFSVYEIPRAGELVPLAWPDIDLIHGIVNFYKAIDRVRNPTVIKGPKNNITRRMPIERNVLPMLEAMKKRAEGRRTVFDWAVLPRADGEYGLSAVLKRDLLAAGVRRQELHVKTPHSRPIRFHDLRATGITWEAIRGDDPAKIHARAGHENYQTTLIYTRLAETLGQGDFGRVFPELPKRLTGREVNAMAQVPVNCPAIVQTSVKYPVFSGKFVGATGFEPVTSSV
ncbi:tyrosine-type recombinase/integrase [Pendulispora brunnea]|uniref:tyrosine-type recombinase/integrase n=1 Tax=Pendulispora brunnea TaxID=2905690 RepID=UPI00374E11E0